MKFQPKPFLALACLLPALGAPPFLGGSGQEGGAQEGPLRTGSGDLVTGTGADPLDDDGPLPRELPRDGVGNRGTDELDVFGRRTKARANTLQGRLLGGWRLVEMKMDGYDDRGRLAQGFLHIGPAFLSMELHALWDNTAQVSAVPVEDIHTSFTAEYHIDGSGTMECTTVIGSYVDDETGELTWERTGYERRYVIRETGKQLVLIFGERGECRKPPGVRAVPAVDSRRDRHLRSADRCGRPGRDGHLWPEPSERRWRTRHLRSAEARGARGRGSGPAPRRSRRGDSAAGKGAGRRPVICDPASVPSDAQH